MNVVANRLIAHIKSKPPDAWSEGELTDFTFAIRTVYVYSNAEDRRILEPIYDKIAKIVNGSREYFRVDPGALKVIDENIKPPK